MRQPKAEADPDMLPEYDFSGGVRGKHIDRFPPGTNVVVLAPDVASVFRDSAAVNEALRLLMRIARDQVKVPAE
jgi:hypothetical protein